MLVFDLRALHRGRCKELHDGSCQAIAKRHQKALRNSDILKKYALWNQFRHHINHQLESQRVLIPFS